jgi:hypothetical protein
LRGQVRQTKKHKSIGNLNFQQTIQDDRGIQKQRDYVSPVNPVGETRPKGFHLTVVTKKEVGNGQVCM